MEKTAKYVVTVFRIFTGAVFIYSGFVKGVDPTGSAIKFHDYFDTFHLGFLQFLALPLAFLLPLLEFLTGVSVLFRFRPKTGVTALFIFMLVFTPLTLILAVFNPVKDCGCFGDALVITNWQTFWKNVVLLIMAVYLFRNRKRLDPELLPSTQWASLAVFTLLFTWISVYSYRNLPLFDFRPYHAGASIPESMIIPEGAPEDVYETKLIYEKNGVKKAFDMDNFPWQDSTWTFVEQKTRLVSKGYEPPIHDFDIILPDGTDITRQLLHDHGYTFLLISHNIIKADTLGLKKAYLLALSAEEKHYGFYLLTSSGDNDIRDVFASTGTEFPYANTDETTLKTIIRSNPGLLLLQNGVILKKWPYRKFPKPDILDHSVLSMSMLEAAQGRNLWLSVFLALFTVCLGIFLNRLSSQIMVCKKAT